MGVNVWAPSWRYRACHLEGPFFDKIYFQPYRPKESSDEVLLSQGYVSLYYLRECIYARCICYFMCLVIHGLGWLMELIEICVGSVCADQYKSFVASCMAVVFTEREEHIFIPLLASIYTYSFMIHMHTHVITSPLLHHTSIQHS